MYTEYKIFIEDLYTSEILIALLSEKSFDTFEEKENYLLAYIHSEKETQEIKDAVLQLSVEFNFTYTTKIYEDKNWNEEWEKNFQPIVISNKVCVRAPFHPSNKEVSYELIIEPRMSFGTGHHASTYLIIDMMLRYNFHQKKICDAGCGTGILSIFASLLGAKEIVAIDNNEWAYDNTVDNQKINQIGKQMKVEMGDISIMESNTFDIILANINKPIIMNNLPLFKSCLTSQGILILSGILLQDELDILQTAASIGFRFVQSNTKEDWVCIVLSI